MVTRFIVPFTAALVLACGASAGAQDLFPEGPGKDILATKCRTCHMPDRVTKVAGRAAETWQALVTTMINRGAPVTEDEIPILVDYLATNWPVDKKVAAVNFSPVAPMASRVKAEFTEWDVPTPASGLTDSLAGSDGSIWYAAEGANLLGRLDPKSGEIKEYQLKTPQSGPHGLAEDRSGNIWYTADLKGHLGKLDPKTGTVTEYPIANPAAHDPNAPVMDPKGNLWFTFEQGNMVGRFSPATSSFTLRNLPTPKSLPAAMALNSKGVPFFAESGANKVASIDPATMVIREYALPADARTRRISIDASDMVWYTDNARGYIGRLDPATGTVKEWASPGGAKAMPFAIMAIGGDIWFSESGAAPNTLVRFEPATERFQTWNIPSGGGSVQNISVTKDGTLALAESDANRIAVVRISR
jgi:virginiamycin B lyase